MAAIHGRTTKIKRYYWRELHRRSTEIFAEWAVCSGIDPLRATGPDARLAREAASKQSLQEIKRLHETNPKYTFLGEESQSDLIAKYNIDVIRLNGTYVRSDRARRAQILHNGTLLSPEQFAESHFREQGYETLFVESVPFHVLFGVFMWLVIQDPYDKGVRIVAFGDRAAFDERKPSKEILCHKPDDFGSPGYAQRRRKEIDRHFSEMLESGDLEWSFEYWLPHSERLRQYLWAHREKDVETARRLVKILPAVTLLRVLRYLVESYWERYLGWPDLLVFKEKEFFFAEVKSSKDGLSDNQKRWVRDNKNRLGLEFKLVKIHKVREVGVGIA